MKSAIFSFFVILIINVVNSKVPNECFRVAVYEHNPFKEPVDKPLRLLNGNLDIYERVAKKAAKYGTQFLVYPEYSLLPELEKNDTLGTGIAAIVPKIGTNPCQNKFRSYGSETRRINDHVVENRAVLGRLSCIASHNRLYVAANIVELEKNTNVTNSTHNNKNDDYLLFNTVVVFDNKGKLVAKYRKFHLFDEIAITQSEKPGLTHFESDFGRFGVAICADSLFENPIRTLVEKEKIDHLIFPTAWYDSYPSMSSLSFHSSLATKYGINVLAANNRHYEIGGFGSGIYTKDSVKVQTSYDNRLLVIADLPKVSSNKTFDQTGKCDYTKKIKIGKREYKEFNYILRNPGQKYCKPILEPKNLLKLIPLDSNEGKINRTCAADVCCELSWKINPEYDYTIDDFYLVLTSRPNHTWESFIYQYEEGCTVVSYDKHQNLYKQNSLTHFDELILKGEFNGTVIYPSVVSSKLKVISRNRYEFKQDENKAEISISNLNRAISFVSLLVRNYDKYLGDPFRNY